MITGILTGGLWLAALYGLLGLGYVVIYRATGVLNFAHGGMVVGGAFIGYALSSLLSPVFSAVAVTLLGVAFGLFFYFLVMRRMAGQPVWVAVLVTVAVGFFVLPGMIQIIWGAESRNIRGDLGMGLTNEVVVLPFGFRFTVVQLAVIVLYLACQVGLVWFFKKGRAGIQMRAAAQDHHLAAHRSMDIDRLFGLAWAIAAALAFLVGYLYGLDQRFELAALPALALKAFPAALAGGMDSIGGVAFGALLIGLAEASVQQLGQPLLASAVPFLILLLVLAVRPWGLFGTPEVIDRV
jgi:branched-chain amino acid transport system permease protein